MNPVTKLIELDKYKPRRILVVGDAMVDVYIHGKTTSTCQEGCTKFVEEERVTVPGGAANAARSLRYWFSRSECIYDYLCGPIKTRYLVDNKVVFRHDKDGIQLDLKVIRNTICDTLGSWKPEGVLISDYDKGLMTPEFINIVISYCTFGRIPCVADVKREPLIYEGAIIKANCNWYDYYRKGDVVTFGDTCPVVVGESIYNNDDFLPEVNCINHVGAGDCFAAHLTLALACGLSLKEAAMVAHSAGRVYVQHLHNEPPKPSEIEADFNSHL